MAKTKKSTTKPRTKSKAKPKKTAKPAPAPVEDLGETGEYHLPIEAKPGRSAGSNPQTRRIMIILALVVGLLAGLLVWILGNNV